MSPADPRLDRSHDISQPLEKLSPEETLKATSDQLRGTIAAGLLEETTRAVPGSAPKLMKFHGLYQQDDRDARKQRSKESVGKHYMFMVRCKIPGGRVTAAQYLVLDDLADRYGNGTLRFTSRQGVQFHGVLKGNLKDTIAAINACLLTTLGACGDVERNVMACPAPHRHDAAHDELQETARVLAAHLAVAHPQSIHALLPGADLRGPLRHHDDQVGCGLQRADGGGKKRPPMPRQQRLIAAHPRGRARSQNYADK